MGDSFRGFIAIDLPDTTREIIANTQKALRNLPGHLKWVRPQSVHLTLKFLGQTCNDIVSPMSEKLETIARGFPTFELCLQGVGVFPNLRRPRVVWIGLQGDLDRLKEIQEKVEKSVEEFGFVPENRTFKPHLTLARVKSGRGDHHWERIFGQTTVENSTPFRVSSFHLFESILKPTGAQYIQKACFRF